MNNQDYWRKRTAEREAHWHELTTAELAKLRRYYKAAHKELEREVATLYAKFAAENGLSITEARKLIRGDEFKEWRMSLREYVAAAEGDPKLLRELNTLAMRSRISRVEAIHARTLTELIELGNRLQETTDKHLYRAYLDTHYGTLYDLHRTVGLHTPPAAVDRPRVESVLQTKWSGKNYSARIWTNTRKLATELQSTITQAIHRGYPIQRLSKNLAQRMNVAYTNAERLILTELNAVETRASADAMKAADFEYYQFAATLDRRTCPICGERDGEVYPLSSMNQGENAPPMHPRCRCTIVASIDDGKQGRKTTDQRAAEKRTRVPADMSYSQWKARFVSGVELQRRWKAQDGHEIIDQPTYNKLTRSFLNAGGLIIRGEEATRHLKLTGAHASYLAGANVAFIADDATISDVLEEMYHAYQDRAKMFGQEVNEIVWLKREIAAQKYLLNCVKKYKIPIEETAVTKVNLERYEMQLAKVMQEGGNSE